MLAEFPELGQLVEIHCRQWVVLDIQQSSPALGKRDFFSRLKAFLDAVRWGATMSADRILPQSPFRSPGKPRRAPAGGQLPLIDTEAE